MKSLIAKLITDNNWTAIYRLCRYQNLPHLQLAIHDAIVENCNVLIQYYFVKAFKMGDNFPTYLKFAAHSANSKHGYKFIFGNVLNHLYNGQNGLHYCHQNPLPKVAEFQKYVLNSGLSKS
jgi:hypothetical protein